MSQLISVKGNGHCCHRPSSNWETDLHSRCSLCRIDTLHSNADSKDGDVYHIRNPCDFDFFRLYL